MKALLPLLALVALAGCSGGDGDTSQAAADVAKNVVPGSEVGATPPQRLPAGVQNATPGGAARSKISRPGG